MFIIRPILYCNLNCKYCYVSEEIKDGSSLDIDSAKKIIDRIKEYSDSKKLKYVNFLWHGGEPLLWGVKNYDAVLEYCDSLFNNAVLAHSIQSNLTLLSEDYIDLIKKYKIQISFSIDGEKEDNDKYRVFKNGKGTYDKVLENAFWLKREGINTSAVVVGSSHNIRKILSIYDFMNQNGFNFKVNPIVKSGNASTIYSEFCITPEEYADSMIALFDKWTNDKHAKINLSFFSEIASNFISKKTALCSFKKNCQETFCSIGPNGDVYPCCYFYGNTLFRHGNIFQSSLQSMFESSEPKKMFDSRLENLDKCRACKYLDICYGGCPFESYSFGNRPSEPTSLCTAYLKIFKHIEDYLISKKFMSL